jgi:hypothetical protein
MRKMLKERRKGRIFTPVGRVSKIALMKELDKVCGDAKARCRRHAPVEVKRAEESKELAKMEEGKKAKKMPAIKTKVGTGVQGVGLRTRPRRRHEQRWRRRNRSRRHASSRAVRRHGTLWRPSV